MALILPSADAQLAASSATGCSQTITYAWISSNDVVGFHLNLGYENNDGYIGSGGDDSVPICNFGETWRYARANPEVGETTNDGWSDGPGVAVFQMRFIHYACGPTCFPDTRVTGYEWINGGYTTFHDVTVSF